MKTRLPLLLIAFLFAYISVFAKRQVTVSGGVYDRLTTKYVLHANVAVLNPDSSVVVEKEAYGMGLRHGLIFSSETGNSWMSAARMGRRRLRCNI